MTNESPHSNFGEWLKDQRAQKNISLEEIAAVTKVHISQLKALESNEFAKLPAPAFVRGFLTSYARHLDIDENILLEHYKTALADAGRPVREDSMPKLARVATPSHQSKVKIVENPLQKKAAARQALQEQGPSPFTMRNIAIAMGVIFILGTMATLLVIGKKKRQNAKIAAAEKLKAEELTANTPVAPAPIAPPEEAAAPVVTKGADTVAKAADTTPAKASDTPAKASSKTTETLAVAKTSAAVVNNYKLEVKAIEQNWINVRIDDQVSRGMSLSSGSIQSFEAQRRISLVVSNAGGIEIRWNGVWYGAPGFRGDVKSIQLPDQLSLLTQKSDAVKAAKPKSKKAAVIPADPAAPATPATPTPAPSVTE